MTGVRAPMFVACAPGPLVQVDWYQNSDSRQTHRGIAPIRLPPLSKGPVLHLGLDARPPRCAAFGS